MSVTWELHDNATGEVLSRHRTEEKAWEVRMTHENAGAISVVRVGDEPVAESEPAESASAPSETPPDDAYVVRRASTGYVIAMYPTEAQATRLRDELVAHYTDDEAGDIVVESVDA